MSFPFTHLSDWRLPVTRADTRASGNSPDQGTAAPRLEFASRFLCKHLWIPLSIAVLISALLMGLDGDQWLADRIYAWGGGAWSLHSAYLTQGVLHAAGRQASKTLWFALALMTACSFFIPPIKAWRMPLLYLLLATGLSVALVGLLKRVTNMECPWDLLRYGGEHAYYGLFSPRPALLGRAQCFPAGHASAGYAWVALYFFCRRARPRWRWWGLGLAVSVGLAFGIAQQLRGAHFLSHDLWALIACWLTALSLYLLMLRSGISKEATT